MALKKKMIAFDAGFADWLAGASLSADDASHDSDAPSTSSKPLAHVAADVTSGVLIGDEDNGDLAGTHACQIFAGGGDDAIFAGMDTSILDGGDGYDRVVLTGETGFHDTTGIVSGWTDIEEIAGTDAGDEINAALAIADQQGLVIATHAGDDLVIATSGNDTIEGGAGNDTVTGGAGSDVFVFHDAGPATDVITDFTAGQDVIAFAGLGIAYENLSISDTPEGTLIIAGHEHVLLAGVQAAALHQGDFRF